MASEAEQVKTEENKTEENKTVRQDGFKVMGYLVPWWVVVFVILLILYVAYENHYLDNIPGIGIFGEHREVALAGPVANIGPAVDTPTDIAEIKRFGSSFGRNNKW